VATAILTAAGRPTWTVLLTAPLVFASVAGNLWLIPKMGPLGAALVTSLVGGMGALAAVMTVYGVWGVGVPIATFVRSLLISAIAFALAATWPVSGFFFLAAKLSAIGLLVPFGFFVLGEFNAAELGAARAVFRRQIALAQNRPSL
jgi:O-antigen/teichoic acid export membrane protein